MSDSPLNFLQASVRANELVANNRLGIGTHTQAAELHVKGAAAEIRLEDGENNGQVTETALKISADAGVTSFQSGTSFTDGSTGDFKFQNMGGANTHMTIDGANSRIGIGTTEPTETLDIVGNLNLQKVSNTASIKLNSNVVTEFVRSKKLIKYPRVAMTQSDESSTTGYVASASGFVNGRYPYEAFTNTNVDDNDCWQVVTASATDGYSDTDGTYTGSERLSSSTPLGEWLKLKSPIAFKLKSYKIIARNSSSYYSSQAPRDAEIWGSNDDTNWTKITEHSGLEFNSQTDSSSFNVSFDNEKYFKYHAIIVTKNNADEFFAVAIGEWELYGIPEYDPEADGTDVIARSVPNVPNTDWLEVYYDGRDFSGTPTSITDKSGNNITATANNITIDTTYQSFEFTQSPKSNIIADNVSFVSGDQQHSIALWFRLKNKNQHNLLFDYRAAGGSTTTGTATGLYVTSYNTGLQFFHQGTDKQVDFDFIPNTWYHLIGTYAGGGGFSGSTIYINGIDVGGVVSGTNTVLDLPATGTITIGDYLHASYGMGDGSIANFRLFNRALSADEIWQLYAYQKEYFGHGNLDMTLKSGRLGIGTPEPRAVLDVRGSIMSSGYILQQNVVCCRHINDNTSTAVNVKIPFDGIVYDPNNLWSKDSDEFFAPVTGVYLAHVNLMTDSSSYDSGNHELRVNGNVFSPRLRGYGVGTGQAQHKNANSHSMVKLQAGDRLSVVSVNASIWYGSATYAHSHVSIHLISDV